MNTSDGEATFVQNIDAKICEICLSPVMLVFINRKALAEYCQMSTGTHVPGFQSFFSFFASICNSQISHQQHKS